MIRHVVMWKVRGDSPTERKANIELVCKAFLGLRGRIPGMTAIELGVDCSRVEYACDVVLVSEFESQLALDSYAVHPEHLRVREDMAGVRIERHQVDYVIDSGDAAPAGET
jgi:hypothetical protein